MEIDKIKVKILLAENNMNQGDLAKKINILLYEFIINGNIWDAAIRLYKKIYDIE